AKKPTAWIWNRGFPSCDQRVYLGAGRGSLYARRYLSAFTGGDPLWACSWGLWNHLAVRAQNDEAGIICVLPLCQPLGQCVYARWNAHYWRCFHWDELFRNAIDSCFRISQKTCGNEGFYYFKSKT